MNDLIYPRSPRETMDGWIHLPRYIDKTGSSSSSTTMRISFTHIPDAGLEGD